MRLYASILILSLFLTSCAAFKELEPKPDLSPFERGYIELKDGKDNFELDAGNKYFIKFPIPLKDRYYLVLTTQEKPFLHSYLTSTFDDGKDPIIPIVDEAISNDSISVYAIDRKVPTFYWVIDEVRRDLVLTLRYRYVPQWRYTFEKPADGWEKPGFDDSGWRDIDLPHDWAIELPFAKFDGKQIISSSEAMTLPALPKSMVVIGAGEMGHQCDLANSGTGFQDFQRSGKLLRHKSQAIHAGVELQKHIQTTAPSEGR